jgi:hypothetical protein
MRSDDEPSLGELSHHGIKGQRWGVRRDFKDARTNFNRVSNELGERQDRRRLMTTLSDEDFKKLDTKDVVIKKGSVVKRTSEGLQKDATFRDLFVSTNERDSATYRAVVPTDVTGGLVGKRHEGYYETTFKATSDLRSPSEKKRVGAYIRMMDLPVVKLSNGESVTGREYMRRQGLGETIDKLTSKQIALAYYGQLSATQGIKDEPLNTAYFSLMHAKGYNALVDDNDRGVLAKSPLLVFDAHKNLKHVSVKQLTTKEVHQAQANLQLPGEV